MSRPSARSRRRRSGRPTSSNMPACGTRSRSSRHRGARRPDAEDHRRHSQVCRRLPAGRRHRQSADRRVPALCDARGDGLARRRSDPFHLGRGGGRDDAGLAHLDRRGDRRARTHPLHPARPAAVARRSGLGRTHPPCADRRIRRARRLVRREALFAQPYARHAGTRDQSRRALRLGGGGRRPAGDLRRLHDRGAAAARSQHRTTGSKGRMILLAAAAIFVVLILFSMPIVFALGVSGVAGLAIGGYDMQVLSSSMVSGSQSWVLLAIPAFVFAGGLMEKCGMSHALVDFARALVGWVKGGLGMSVIVVAYFFSDICGSKMAEVSALGSTLMPPLTKAGYKRQDSASLIAAGTAMGMLVPPAIFMIVIAQVTNTSAVALFLAGFVPAATIMVCLMVLVYFRARKYDWPVDTRPNPQFLWNSAKRAAVPLVIPIVILGGFFLGIFTATEAGAVVAGYAFIAARFYYKNVTFREMAKLAYESAILTAAVVFLLAVASVFQYLMGVSGVPKLLADVLGPLKSMPWLFLLCTALITMMFGMVLEGLPAAVVLIPVVFPIAEAMGIDPIHFNIVQTAAVGIGLFLPPMGVGLLMALKFANLTVGEHWRSYLPYIAALLVGLMLISMFPQLSLFLPRSAGFIK